MEEHIILIIPIIAVLVGLVRVSLYLWHHRKLNKGISSSDSGFELSSEDMSAIFDDFFSDDKRENKGGTQ